MQTKDSKPRKKVLTGWAYAHAAYLADALCDPAQPRDLSEAAEFGIKELCTLLGLENPKPAATPKAWKAVRQIYIDARRAAIELAEKHGRPDRRMQDVAQSLTTAESHSIAGLTFRVAAEMSELLHQLWCVDNLTDENDEVYAHSGFDFAGRRAPANVLRNLKELQHTRRLIEEYGQSRIIAAAARLAAALPLKDFIEGAHFRVTLTPTVKR